MLDNRVIIIVVVVCLIVGVAGSYYWTSRDDEWNIKKLEEALVDTNSSGEGPAAFSFDEELAGESRRVAGEVTDIESNTTSQGEIFMIELDDFSQLSLIEWGECQYEIGDEIEKEVHFEWSTWNDGRYVFSKQVGYPELLGLSLSKIRLATSHIAGLDFAVSRDDDGTVQIELSDPFPKEGYGLPLDINKTECSLYEGGDSPVVDYKQSFLDNESDQLINNITMLDDEESGQVEFFNMNNQSLLDTGDYFEIRGLERPDQENSVFTYHLVIEDEEQPEPLTCFLAMNDQGLLQFTD